MSETSELPPEVTAQLTEALENPPAEEPAKLKTRTIAVCGQMWQIPSQPTVGYLYDLSRAEETSDFSQVKAMMSATRTLLGDKQFERFRLLDAETAIEQLHNAAQKAYGIAGNSPASPGS